jgi:hypothetical protein
VFSSSKDLTPLSAPHDSSSDARTAIQSVSQSHKADALNEHIHSLLLDPAYDSVWVYTDRELQNNQTVPRLIVNQLPIEPATQTNAWIKHVEKRPNDSIAVSIGYGGATARDALVDGECYAPESVTPRKITSQTVRLTPQENATAELRAPSPTWQYCRVHVRLQDASLFDSLPLDNEGWIAHAPSSLSIRVAGSLSPEQLGLSKIPSMSFIAAGPDASPNLSTIFHRQAPQAIPTTASLIVMPPVGALPWGGRVLTEGLGRQEITRWDEAHPLLTYVKPALLTLPETRILECPPSGTPILFSASGAVLCVGEERGARYVVVGFELFPFDGSKNPTLSILTLNIFKWLFQSAGGASGSSLPSTLSIPENTSGAEYLEPSQSSLLISGNAVSPKHPGVIEFKHTDGSKTHIALNAFEDEESKLSERASLSISPQTSTPRSVVNDSSSQNLISWLISLALGVLAADLLRRVVRRIRWSDA